MPLICLLHLDKPEEQERSLAGDTIQAVKPCETKKNTPYSLYLLPSHCHHNQSDWLLRCSTDPPPSFVSFPALALPITQYIS